MTTIPELSHHTGAVVVLFQPTTDVLENLKILSSQVDQLVIVDNGSNEEFLSLLQPSLNSRVKLIQHSENLGIATGFNTGLRSLIDSECKFVFTFDQDSRIPNAYVQNMVASFQKAELRFGLIGVLMPLWRNPQSNDLPFKDDGVREVSQGISSGSLYSVNVFQNLGFFADEYFIDGVDIEFCLRCQTQNWKVTQDTSLVIEHSLGNEVNISLLGFRIPIIVHSPFRKYFMARNRILNYRKYAIRNWNWFLADFWIFIREIFHIIAYEEEKNTKLRYTFTGIKDGFRNRTGKINKSLE
jgi:rhamnosyltransferase